MQLMIIDAFARGPFTGNQAAVCFSLSELDEGWMQNLAAEMNLAETAFVRRQEDCFELRWFTPAFEVDLCGHATLAAAHMLWEKEIVTAGASIAFQTKSGTLTARQAGEHIQLDFPATPPSDCPPAEELLAALGIENPLYTGQSPFDDFVVLATEHEVLEIEPDFPALKRCTKRGVIVTSRSTDADSDFVSRFFAPKAGIDEDPVTGSAHCCLAPYWKDQMGRGELVGYQASKRGGVVRTKVIGERVQLAGQAITIVEGEVRA